jgi:hypothetical protein
VAAIMNGQAKFTHHAVVKQNVCPADQANLQYGFSREHGWGASLFRVVEWSIALRGMITFRKMGQYQAENGPMSDSDFRGPLQCFR